MTRQQLEIAHVFRRHGREFISRCEQSLSVQQRRVIRDVTSCRTKQLGGHVQRCRDCGHERIAYNSCRNRHCPKCQAGLQAKWMAARERELLPVPYFHVVFTLPKPLAALAFQNKKVIYGMLFQAAAETLAEVAENPRHLGARIGFVAILHTWGQNLMHHPHLHCVVPAGGIALDQSRWVPCRQTKERKPFFLPVRVLSRVFRGKFIHKLKKAYQRRNLVFVNCLSRLAKSPEFSQMIDRVVETDWVVYAKQPFGGPAQVLKYLSRYTHRVAISNQRLVSMQDGRVTFRWKDYADSSRTKAMTLTGCEFMRRFLIHTLPAGFTRIRHYGFLANRNRTENIQRCRALLPDANTTSECESRKKPSDMNECVLRCPECKTGKMVIVEAIRPERFNLPTPHFTIRHPPLVFDSS